MEIQGKLHARDFAKVRENLLNQCQKTANHFQIGSQWRIQNFPDGGGRQPQRWRQKPIIWPHFSQKLHENERNQTLKGGGEERPWRPALDPPLAPLV